MPRQSNKQPYWVSGVQLMSLISSLIVLSATLLVSPGALAQRDIKIAVLPVEVNSSAEAEFLRQGVADMLAARLAQHKGLSVIRIDDLASATNSMETARRTGQTLGANYVLYGSLTRFGRGASLDLVCAKVLGSEETDPRSVFIQSGDLSSLIPQLDPVVERIAFYINAGPKPRDEALDRPSVQDALDQIDTLNSRLNSIEAEMAANENPPVSEESPTAPFLEELEALKDMSQGETSEVR